MDYHKVLSLLGEYDTVYLLDINGIESRNLQSDVIRKVGTRKEVWADVGARDTATITDAYIAGADRVVISTKTMYSMDLIIESSKLSHQMIFCIDYKDGIITPSEEMKSIQIKDLILKAVEAGIETIVIHDLNNEDFQRSLLDYIPDKDYELFIGGNIKMANIESYEPFIDGVILGLEESIEWQVKN